MLNWQLLIFCFTFSFHYNAPVRALRVFEFPTGNETFVISDATFILQTQGFPEPTNLYTGKISIVYLESLTGRGYHFYFQELLLGVKDQLKICSVRKCIVKRGDEMIHREDNAFVPIEEGNITVTLIGSQLENSLHTGFRVFVQQYDLNEKRSDCKQQIVLNDDKPTFFLKSPGYPSSIKKPPLQCIYNFSTTFQSKKQGIRVQFFDFHAIDVNFNVAGKNLEARFENQTFAGYLTRMQSFAKYYLKSAVVTYSTISEMDLQNFNRFFLIVDIYLIQETITRTLGVNPDGGTATSNLNGQAIYPSNANFTWQTTHLPQGFRLAMLIDLETEACCDYLEISGVRNNSTLDDWHFQGQYNKKILFAENSNVELRFISDAFGQAKGFTTNFYQQNCSCGTNSYLLSADSLSLQLNSPGYETSKLRAYCPNLECKWRIAFDLKKYYLEFTFEDFYLRNVANEKTGKKNVVTITNQMGLIIAELDHRNNSKTNSAVNLSSGVANIAFTSDSAIFYDEVSKGRGFALKAQLKTYPSKPTITEEIYLNASQSFAFIELSSKEGELFSIHNIYGSNKNPIQLFILEHSDALVDVFDGPSPTAKLLYSNSVLPNKYGWENPIESTSSSLELRIYSTENFKKFVAIAVAGDTPLCTGRQVYSIVMESSLEMDLASIKSKCSTILYFPIAGPDNFNALELDIPVNKGVELYKGLSGNDLFLLASSSPYPKYVYAKFIRLEQEPTRTKQIIKVKTTVKDSTQTIKRSQAAFGFIMSPDFPFEQDPSSTKQALIYHLDTESSTPIPIDINLDASVDQSQIQIRLKRSVEEDEYELVHLNGVSEGGYCGVALDVVYGKEKDKHGSGIFGTYSMDGNKQYGSDCLRELNSAPWKLSHVSNYYVLVIIIFTVLIF